MAQDLVIAWISLAYKLSLLNGIYVFNTIVIFAGLVFWIRFWILGHLGKVRFWIVFKL